MRLSSNFQEKHSNLETPPFFSSQSEILQMKEERVVCFIYIKHRRGSHQLFDSGYAYMQQGAAPMAQASDNPILAHAGKWKEALTSELTRLQDPMGLLSDRERQILHLLAKGRKADEIARIFHLEKGELLSSLAKLQQLSCR